LEVATERFTDVGVIAFLVMECHEGKGEWNGMRSWNSAVGYFKGADDEVLERSAVILPEDNATIIFTSGTTGLPKGVLSTQRMYLTNVFNVCFETSHDPTSSSTAHRFLLEVLGQF